MIKDTCTYDQDHPHTHFKPSLFILLSIHNPDIHLKDRIPQGVMGANKLGSCSF